MPRVFIMHEDQPNAFATGRNPQNAAVAVTTGLMNHLSREELAGVIAHELAHIKNHDTLIMTITATFAGAISMIAQFGMFFGGNRDNNGPGIIGSIAMMILAPLAAMLVQMAISRTREYAADDMGARICGQPMWLASALAKIENAAHQIPNPEAERNPATAHMFIINPLSGQGMDNLFATHPSTENRDRRAAAARRPVRRPRRLCDAQRRRRPARPVEWRRPPRSLGLTWGQANLRQADQRAPVKRRALFFPPDQSRSEHVVARGECAKWIVAPPGVVQERPLRPEMILQSSGDVGKAPTGYWTPPALQIRS